MHHKLLAIAIRGLKFLAGRKEIRLAEAVNSQGYFNDFNSLQIE